MSNQSHKLVRAAVLVCAATFIGSAFAQDAGPYVSGSLGRSKTQFEGSALSSVGVTSISDQDHDTGWKANLGFQFNRYWGVEAGYVDFGDFTQNGTSPLGVPVRGTTDLTAWTVAVVGTLPLGNSNFSLLGKLGAAWGDVQGRATVDGTRVSLDDDGADFFGGFGVRYDFNQNLGVQFDWERYYFNDRTYMYSLGLRYKF